jgi:2-iminobutanoate/2-iminopropanoate deaminase
MKLFLRTFAVGIILISSISIFAQNTNDKKSVKKVSSSKTIKKVVLADKAPKPIGPYSQAIIAKGTFIYLSGQIALKPDGTMAENDIEKQTRLVFENMSAVLHSAGLTFDNIVKTTVMLKDLNDFAKMNTIYAEYFKVDPPARATFQVARLPKDAMIEIEAVAVIPEK